MFYSGYLDQLQDEPTLRVVAQHACRKYNSQQNRLEQLEEENRTLKEKLLNYYRDQACLQQPQHDATQLREEILQLRCENNSLKKAVEALADKLSESQEPAIKQLDDYLTSEYFSQRTNTRTLSMEKQVQTVVSLANPEEREQSTEQVILAADKIVSQQKVIQELQETILQLKQVLRGFGVWI